jgi:hypothetical protein
MDFIIGVNFMSDYNVELNFEKRYLITSTGQKTTRHQFCNVKTQQVNVGNEERMRSIINIPGRKCGEVYSSTTGYPEREDEMSCLVSPGPNKNDVSGRIDSECGSRFPARYCDKFNEDENVEDGELRASNPNVLHLSCSYRSPCSGHNALNEHTVARENKKMVHTYPDESALRTQSATTDRRAITVPELHQKTEEAKCLDVDQRKQLFDLLEEYKGSFTSKPGKCSLMKYSFEVLDEHLIIGTSRPIPFAVRKEVREQIDQLSRDRIIEHSTSSYINPLTVVIRPSKPPRICLDARRVNKHMVPDRTRVSPVQELLQRFYGSRYISSIDLSSAFLQVELAPECRKFTAFLFENEVFQFTRVPYGLRNSLPAFVRALNLALGTDTSGFALAYVDDITVFFHPLSAIT